MTKWSLGILPGKLAVVVSEQGWKSVRWICWEENAPQETAHSAGYLLGLSIKKWVIVSVSSCCPCTLTLRAYSVKSKPHFANYRTVVCLSNNLINYVYSVCSCKCSKLVFIMYFFIFLLFLLKCEQFVLTSLVLSWNSACRGRIHLSGVVLFKFLIWNSGNFRGDLAV